MKTVHHITFDDSVYGHEIHDSWEFNSITAMCYCNNRQSGYSKAESLAIIVNSEYNDLVEFVSREDAKKYINDMISEWELPEGFDEFLN